MNWIENIKKKKKFEKVYFNDHLTYFNCGGTFSERRLRIRIVIARIVSILFSGYFFPEK